MEASGSEHDSEQEADQQNEYERQRQERIAQNLAKLEALGVPDAAQNLANKAGSRKKARAPEPPTGLVQRRASRRSAAAQARQKIKAASARATGDKDGGEEEEEEEGEGAGGSGGESASDWSGDEAGSGGEHNDEEEGEELEELEEEPEAGLEADTGGQSKGRKSGGPSRPQRTPSRSAQARSTRASDRGVGGDAAALGDAESPGEAQPPGGEAGPSTALVVVEGGSGGQGGRGRGAGQKRGRGREAGGTTGRGGRAAGRGRGGGRRGAAGPPQPLTEDEVARVFQMFGAGAGGYISDENVRQQVEKLGVPLDEDMLDNMMAWMEEMVPSCSRQEISFEHFQLLCSEVYSSNLPRASPQEAVAAAAVPATAGVPEAVPEAMVVE